MKYTGIRAVPRATPRRIMQPHLARYEFATQVIHDAINVLDVACGTGYGASILKSGGCKRVYGADLDWSAVAYASRNFCTTDSITFVQANGAQLPFGDNSFDLITCFETFEHILDSRAFLTGLCRILKPIGVLVISVPNAPMWQPFGSPPNLAMDYIRLGLGHKHNFGVRDFFAVLNEYFETVTPYGQDFRKASLTGKVFRQLERVQIFLKFCIVRYGVIKWALGRLLNDVLPQEDLRFRDAQWRVKVWPNQSYEPVFCVAFAKGKRQ